MSDSNKLAPPRLLPDRDLPPYSYVPGKFPHPLSHPAGHSYQATHEQVVLDGDDLSDCRQLQWGVDLFNQGYYWEAHEAWEQVWLALGRQGEAAKVIKLAAAGVKAREGRPAGVVSHARRASELLESASSLEHIGGIALDRLQGLAQIVLERGETLLTDSDDPVVRLMPGTIETTTAYD